MSKYLEVVESILNDLMIDINDEEIFNTIKQALTPPTANEVCEALSEYYKDYEVTYLKEEKTFVRTNYAYTFDIVWEDAGEICFKKNTTLPPRLITLIGKFYESEETNNVD